MNNFYKCSVIFESLEDKKIIEKQLLSNTKNLQGIPDRNVTKSKDNLNSFSKIGVYFLTREEYFNLSNSNKIKSIQLIPTQEDIESYTGVDDSLGNISKFEESTQIGEYWRSPVSQNSVSFGLAYHTDNNPTNLYSGSGGSYTADKYFNTRGTDSVDRYNYVLDGTGVDFINFENCNHLHYEFFDKNGKSRIQYVNWYELTGQPESASKQPALLYSNTSNSNYHGTMTAGIAVGLVNGFAKNAKIYILPTQIAALSGTTSGNSFTFSEAMSLVKRFHESKSIDPNTGYKRPTVVNMSLAWDTTPNSSYWAYPSFVENGLIRGVNHSASFEIGNLNENEGVYFTYLNGIYAVVSSSQPNPYSTDYKNGQKFIVNTYTGDNNDLVSAINNFKNTSFWNYDFFVTCSLAGNTISVTSSFRPFTNPSYGSVQRGYVHIYTSSFDPLNDFAFPIQNKIEQTGSLVAILDYSSSIVNHINSIVVNGVEQVTDGSNDNYLNNLHYAPQHSSTDMFGNVNNGYHDPNSYTSTSQRYDPSFDIYSPILDEICQEVAEAGVILVKAGGNRATWVSQTGSTENNPFFDPDRCNNILANNYFSKDVDTGTLFLAGEKIYYNRTQPSNGSAIMVGNGPNYSSYSNYSLSFANSDGFPLLVSAGNTGPGIDVYSPGNYQISACGATYSGKDMDNHNLLTNINFDTASVINNFSNNFPEAYANSYTNFSSAYTQTFSGGTSTSSPRVAGIICCYLQLYPWANVKDIRNWLKSMSTHIPNSDVDFTTTPLYKKFLTIDATGSIHNLTISSSQTIQMGTDNSPILHFPFGKLNPIEITGSINMSGVNFSL